MQLYQPSQSFYPINTIIQVKHYQVQLVIVPSWVREQAALNSIQNRSAKIVTANIPAFEVFVKCLYFIFDADTYNFEMQM